MYINSGRGSFDYILFDSCKFAIRFTFRYHTSKYRSDKSIFFITPIALPIFVHFRSTQTGCGLFINIRTMSARTTLRNAVEIISTAVFAISKYPYRNIGATNGTFSFHHLGFWNIFNFHIYTHRSFSQMGHRYNHYIKQLCYILPAIDKTWLDLIQLNHHEREYEFMTACHKATPLVFFTHVQACIVLC